jgi:hypothetical protein
VVSFTPRPLYPRYPLYRRFGEPKSRSGRHGEMKILAPPGLELRILRPPALSQSLYRLSYPGSLKLWIIVLSEFQMALEGGVYHSGILNLRTLFIARYHNEYACMYFHNFYRKFCYYRPLTAPDLRYIYIYIFIYLG